MQSAIVLASQFYIFSLPREGVVPCRRHNNNNPLYEFSSLLRLLPPARQKRSTGSSSIAPTKVSFRRRDIDHGETTVPALLAPSATSTGYLQRLTRPEAWQVHGFDFWDSTFTAGINNIMRGMRKLRREIMNVHPSILSPSYQSSRYYYYEHRW